MKKQTKLVLIMVLLCLMDMVIPIPFYGLLLLHVVLTRPPWFRDMVREIYSE